MKLSSNDYKNALLRACGSGSLECCNSQRLFDRIDEDVIVLICTNDGTISCHPASAVSLNFEIDNEKPCRCELAYYWQTCGFPVICMSHELAADLMLTDIDFDCVRAPWDCFFIEVPQDLLSASDGSNIVNIFVWLGTDDSGHPLWKYEANADCPEKSFLREWVEWRELAHDHSCGRLPADEQERLACFVDTFVLNTVLAPTLSGPSGQGSLLAHQPPARRKNKPGRKAQDLPQANRYVLGRPVAIQLRSPEEKKELLKEVRAYVRTGRGRLSKRFVKRGHFRNQACGHRWSEHRRLWIQPHVVGPRNAPQLIRAHRLVQAPQEGSSGNDLAKCA